MKRKLKFYLTILPNISITAFIALNIIAIYHYPGYDKCAFLKGEYCKSNKYSFKYNFFSELGSINTNTDDDYLLKKKKNKPLADIINKEAEKKIPLYKEAIKPLTDKIVDRISPKKEVDGGDNNKSNLKSMILFNSSLVIVGITLIIFYRYFNIFFNWKKDSVKSKRYSKVSRNIGVITGILFAGIGFFPHDLNYTAHVFFANGAFTALLFLSITHTLSFKNSKYINTNYAFGHVLFCVALLSYLYLIFLGPQIGPGIEFTAKELALQVISQKVIILIFAISIIYQTIGIRKVLK